MYRSPNSVSSQSAGTRSPPLSGPIVAYTAKVASISVRDKRGSAGVAYPSMNRPIAKRRCSRCSARYGLLQLLWRAAVRCHGCGALRHPRGMRISVPAPPAGTRGPGVGSVANPGSRRSSGMPRMKVSRPTNTTASPDAVVAQPSASRSISAAFVGLPAGQAGQPGAEEEAIPAAET